MSPPNSTFSRLTKAVHWLFLDPANENNATHVIDLSGHDWQHMITDCSIREPLTEGMREWFDFHPKLSTLELWIVSLPAPLFVYVLNSRSSVSQSPPGGRCQPWVDRGERKGLQSLSHSLLTVAIYFTNQLFPRPWETLGGASRKRDPLHRHRKAPGTKGARRAWYPLGSGVANAPG